MALLLRFDSMGCPYSACQLVEGEALLWSRACGELLEHDVRERFYVNHISAHLEAEPLESAPRLVRVEVQHVRARHDVERLLHGVESALDIDRVRLDAARRHAPELLDHVFPVHAQPSTSDPYLGFAWRHNYPHNTNDNTNDF